MCSLLFSTKIPNPNNILHINEYIQKRGPDTTNYMNYEGFFLLHNLLSMTGKITPQPLFSSDKKIAVIYNGEVYNYKSFGDYSCDSECLIPLYQKHGQNFLKMLSGEFAIVLVDITENEILISTDTFCCKPLFVSTTGGIGVATYKSALERIGFSSITKIPANTTLLYDIKTMSLKGQWAITDFALNQHKETFTDFHKAFSNNITQRCANVREHISIGLSSGMDSGMIACELAKQNIPFKCYSVIGSENRRVLEQRYAALQGKCELEIITISPEMKRIAHEWLLKNTEDYKYTICSSQREYNEFYLSLADDNGSNNLSHILSLAKRDNKKIFISGGGADEMYDYGGRYLHSNFNGIFPADLKTIFPWNSVFGSSMSSYIMKDEIVGGSYGLETRYPFITPEIWQEFLWLSQRLKNKCYKSAMDDYLTINGFPYQPNEKIGF